MQKSRNLYEKLKMQQDVKSQSSLQGSNNREPKALEDMSYQEYNQYLDGLEKLET